MGEVTTGQDGLHHGMQDKHRPSFAQRKRTFLSKLDKSAAGGIDARAVEVCEVLNAKESFFTTSSCSGRALLYCGEGVKSTDKWVRFRVTHDLVDDAAQYFDLSTLSRENEYVGDHENQDGAARMKPLRDIQHSAAGLTPYSGGATECYAFVQKWFGSRLAKRSSPGHQQSVVWLRFEPFILHVCCRDLDAAAALMAAARNVFKNVGLQLTGCTDSKIMVAICGDEGLDMPLTSPEDGRALFPARWLQGQVNDRHQRNWAKIDRFTAALRDMDEPASSAIPLSVEVDRSERDAMRSSPVTDNNEELLENSDADCFYDEKTMTGQVRRPGPRRLDIVGDVVILQCPPAPKDEAAVGRAVLKQFRQASIVAVRRAALSSELRRPDSLDIIAGPGRSPLITTHLEFGVRYVIDLGAVFFSTRMSGERQRLCGLVCPGEHVLIPFAGCGPEVLQIAAKTSAESICAVELNPDAVACAKRGVAKLRQVATEAAGKIQVLEADVRALDLPQAAFHRIVAPRPKGEHEDDDDGAEFLRALLPFLRHEGVFHWYDFVADWELPHCDRTRKVIESECAKCGVRCKVLRAAAANRRTVAERQYRVVVDFEVFRE